MKKRWNVVDVIALLFLVVGMGLVIYRMVNFSKPISRNAKGEKMLMKFEIEEVETSVLKDVKVGDVATDHRKQFELGNVGSIVLDEAIVYVADAEGMLHISRKKDFSSAKISLEVFGSVSEDGIRLGSFKYLIGEKVILTLGKSVIYATVSGFESTSEVVSTAGKSSQGEFAVVAFAESVPNYVGDHIKAGDLVMENVAQKVIGRVRSVEIGSAKEYRENSEGELVESPKEGYSGVKIVIDTDGEMTDRGIVIGKITYYVGKTMELSVGQALLGKVRFVGLE